MRTTRRARWLCIAVALSSLAPAALADPADPTAPRDDRQRLDKKKSVADCVSFQQRELDDDAGVELTLSSACEAPLACGIKWSLTCAPGSKRAKKTRGAYAFTLEGGASDGATVTTEACGFDGWEIADVSWSCAPPE